MYTDIEQWTEIRRRILVEKVSQHQVLRETEMHWKTLQKILEHSEPPGYRRQVAFTKPKIGPFPDRVQQILEDDRRVSRSQRQELSPPRIKGPSETTEIHTQTKVRGN